MYLLGEKKEKLLTEFKEMNKQAREISFDSEEHKNQSEGSQMTFFTKKFCMRYSWIIVQLSEINDSISEILTHLNITSKATTGDISTIPQLSINQQYESNYKEAFKNNSTTIKSIGNSVERPLMNDITILCQRNNYHSSNTHKKQNIQNCFSIPVKEKMKTIVSD